MISFSLPSKPITKGAFGNNGVDIPRSKDKKGKFKFNKKPSKKVVIHRPGKYVPRMITTGKGKSVRAKVWVYLDELK